MVMNFEAEEKNTEEVPSTKSETNAVDESALRVPLIQKKRHKKLRHGIQPAEEQPSPRKLFKVLQSVGIYYSTFAYGCAYTFLSPAVLALSRKYETDVSHISFVFTILTVMYLTSALLCGFLYNLVKNRSLVIMALLTLMTVPLFAIPHVNDINAFFFLGAVLGAGCGGYDVGQVAGIIEIWRGEAALYILTQHFAYSLGTILPSVILHSFLPENITEMSVDGPIQIPKQNQSHSSTGYRKTNQKSIVYSGPFEEANLVIPFSIAGGIVALGIIIHALIFIHMKYYESFCTRGAYEKLPSENTLDSSSSSFETSSQSGQNSRKNPQIRRKKYYVKVNNDSSSTSTNPNPNSNLQEDGTTWEKLQPSNHGHLNEPDGTKCSWMGRLLWKCDRRTVILTLLSCAVIGPYRGMELTTMQFLPTFSVFSDVHLSEAQGTRVLFSMNTAYATGRFLGILLGLKFRPELILLGNFVLVLISNVILLVAGQSVENYLWVGSICLGAGLSTIFPSYYSYIEKFFFVSHSVVSVITVSDGILASIYPLVVGNFVERNPTVLIWVNFFSMTVVFLAFGITYYMTKIRSSR